MRTLDLERWRAFDAAHPAPTFFARPAWALALERSASHYAAEALMTGRARTPTTLLPVMRVRERSFPWVRFVAHPMGGYTAVLREDGAVADEAQTQAALCELWDTCDHAEIVLWPFSGCAQTGRSLVRQRTTHAIDLAEGAEAALSRFKGVTRRMVGQAERRGLRCGIERGPQAIDTYYAMLHEEAVGRWGLSAPSISRRLLEAVVHFGGDDVEIWIARYNGEAVAGGVVLYGSSESFFWSAAMRHQFSALRPSNALNARLIRAAADRGLRWYNLGSSEEIPGVIRFKESLGAVPFAYAFVEYDSSRYRLYGKVRGAVRALTG